MRPARLLLALCAGLVASAPARADVFLVDPEASQVRVTLGRGGLFGFLGHRHTIAAPIADGRVETDATDLARSRVELRWEAARLSIVPGTEPAGDVAEVESRMRGETILDAARHADIAFVSSSVAGQAEGDGAYRLVVRGTLTLRGRPSPIEVPLDVRLEASTLTARGSARLRLRDLGIAPPSVAGVVKVSNDFTVSFEIQARRAAGSP